MKKQWELTQDAFETLLNWLDSDRDQAGRKYEEIRLRLIKIFTCRRCLEAEDLADETINRVSLKAGDLAETYEGNPALYFYGVAQKVQLEYARKLHPIGTEPDLNRLAGNAHQSSTHVPPDPETDHRCLDECLEKLPPENRRLVLEYYQHEKQGKIDHRKRLADELGIAANALRIRAHRIRRALQECLQDCLAEQLAN